MPIDASVLIVGADAARRRLAEALAPLGVEVRQGGVGAAVEALDARPCDVVLAHFDESEAALVVLDQLHRRHAEVAIVLVVTRGEVGDAVRAMRSGAADFLLEPVNPEHLRFAVGRAAACGHAASAPTSARAAIVGASPPMQKLTEMIGRAATGISTVLVRGESGTGKELVARAVHDESPRSRGAFVKVHCAALPDTLLESELFGYEKGAFTGAHARKLGRVDLAQGGTLFLDEIGDITPALQVKLLRLLQDKEFERLGGGEPIRADVRFVAATHRDLEDMVKKGAFREDLFYRLNVVTLWLPPLRARRDDVLILARHFVRELGPASGRPNLEIAPAALECLRGQRWPGNVRQLRNVIERIAVLIDHDVIDERDVQGELSESVKFATEAAGVSLLSAARSLGTGEVKPLAQEVERAERQALKRALEHARGNRALAARLLGVSRATLYNKLEQYGLG
ncbi:MAG: sigma-54-dependent Fis family transcriptional regulator [Myxococcales bacterium]|nr:sigma-54-dependent Fis family transcriptional regulator [Myxococcales bacterium]